MGETRRLSLPHGVMMDYSTLPPDLKALVAEVRNPNHGFFGPTSYSWRLLRENTIQLAGPYAALMQVAHPHVAQGVYEHSNYNTDPIGRLERTFHAVHNIMFGTVEDALKAVLHARDMHKTVRGTTPYAAPGFETGARYHANRADLLLWVHATLIEGALLAHERFIRPLTTEEKHVLYEEAKVFGRLFGVPLEKYPAGYPEFQAYYEDMIQRQIAVTPAAKEIADNIIWNSGYFKLAAPLTLVLAAGLLPANIRQGFGLPWNRAMGLALEQFTKAYRASRTVTLPQLLYRRAYLRALKRVNAPLPPREGAGRLEKLVDTAYLLVSRA